MIMLSTATAIKFGILRFVHHCGRMNILQKKYKEALMSAPLANHMIVQSGFERHVHAIELIFCDAQRLV